MNDDSGNEKLHGWFGLSYAEYLTIPRSVLQSMPDAWQGKMADLLKELDELMEWRPKSGTCYFVELRNVHEDPNGRQFTGRKLEDPLADYQRGRRRLLRKRADYERGTNDQSGQ